MRLQKVSFGSSSTSIGITLSHSVSEDRMAAAGAMLTAIFSDKRTESGLSERQFEFKSFTIIVARSRTGSDQKIAD